MRWWSAVWKLWCLKYITYSLFQWCILSLDLKHNTYIHTYMYICIRPMHKTWEVISIGWWIFYTEKKWANLILSLASAEKVEHGMFFLASQIKVYGLQEFQNWKKLLLVSCSVWQLIFTGQEHPSLLLEWLLCQMINSRRLEEGNELFPPNLSLPF